MDAKTIIDQTEQYYLPVFGRYQLALTHGKGCKLYDADGNEYLDFLAGIAVNSLGHAHPALIKAISEQAAKLNVMTAANTNSVTFFISFSSLYKITNL